MSDPTKQKFLSFIEWRRSSYGLILPGVSSCSVVKCVVSSVLGNSSL